MVLTAQQIRSILYHQYQEGKSPEEKADIVFKIADRNYLAPTERQVIGELQATLFEGYKFKMETMDCDDFALLFHGWVRQKQYKYKWPQPLAFGEAWSKNHAFNIVILSDSTVHLIEPQTDGLLPADAYAVNFVRMQWARLADYKRADVITLVEAMASKQKEM